MKKCNKCSILRPLHQFSAQKRGFLGKRSDCKSCQKEYRLSNLNKIKALNKAWRIENPLSSRPLIQQLKVKQYKQVYCANAYKNLTPLEREELRIRKRQYEKERRLTNIGHRIKVNLRSRLYKAIKNNQKTGSAIDDLGCSIEQLRIYIESLFKPGMTWDNWGKGKNKWHIDHIIPLSRFDLNDDLEFKKAVHYSNLQPLWQTDNLRKSDND